MSGDRVWLVVSGEYDDYRVECAAANETDAAQIVAAMRSDGRRGIRLKSVRLVTPPVKLVPVYATSVTVWDDGRVERGELRHSPRWPWEAPGPVTWRWMRGYVHGGKGARMSVFGTDRDLVLAVAAEQTARTQAEMARQKMVTG